MARIYSTHGTILYQSEGVSTVREACEAANALGLSLECAQLQKADLSWADLPGARLRCGRLSCADLTGADLTGAELRLADFERANLCHARLKDADLSLASLMAAQARNACLLRAKLEGANLGDANLYGADLSYARMMDARLNGASLVRADLTGADLSRTNLAWTDFIDAQLAGTCLDPEAQMPKVTDEQLSKHDLKLDGERVYGWRTACSQHVGSTFYEPRAEPYVAPVFSLDLESDCHPGIYLDGLAQLTQSCGECGLGSLVPVVKCWCRRDEVLVTQGDAPKVRCKRLWVIAEGS